MTIKNLTGREFDDFIRVGSCVVDFYADWCGPCKMLKPLMEQTSQEIKDVKFAKVDVDRETSLAQKFDVMSIPTVIFFKNGEQIDRTVGFLSKEELVEKAEEIKR